MENTIGKRVINLSKEAAFILLTVVGAVLLPQVVHGLGVILGVGGKLGQMLLPMYLPVFIIGVCRGSVHGAVVGLTAPIISFAITGMPTAVLLPYITVELVATGLLAGAFRSFKLTAVLRVLLVQVVAKIVRLAVFATVMYLNSGVITATDLFAGIVTSVPGVLIQLAVISFIIIAKEKKNNV